MRHDRKTNGKTMEQTLSVVRRSLKQGRPLGNVTIADLIKTHVFIPWSNYEWRLRHVEALRRLGFKIGYLENPENLDSRAGLGFYSEDLVKTMADQGARVIEVPAPLKIQI